MFQVLCSECVQMLRHEAVRWISLACVLQRILVKSMRAGRATVWTAKLSYSVDMLGNLNGFNVGCRVETKRPYCCEQNIDFHAEWSSLQFSCNKEQRTVFLLDRIFCQKGRDVPVLN